MSEHPFAKQSCVGGAARAVILRLETRWRSRVREAGAYRPKFGDLNLHIKAPAGFFQKAKVKLRGLAKTAEQVVGIEIKCGLHGQI